MNTIKLIYKIEHYLVGFLFVSGLMISLYGVFMRYVMRSPVSWVTEIYTLCFVTAIFIGLGIALRNNEHIAIEIVYDRMSTKWKKVTEFFALIIGILFSLFLLITGGNLVVESFAQGIKSISSGVPVWLTYLIIPISSFLLLVHYLVKVRNFIKND